MCPPPPPNYRSSASLSFNRKFETFKNNLKTAWKLVRKLIKRKKKINNV